MKEESNSGSWGGAREGAGRKKTAGKYYGFNATPENERAIERLAAAPGFKRAEFINAAISEYISSHNL